MACYATFKIPKCSQCSFPRHTRDDKGWRAREAWACHVSERHRSFTIFSVSMHKAPKARMRIARHAAKQVPGREDKKFQVPPGTADENDVCNVATSGISEKSISLVMPNPVERTRAVISA